jgi:predicted MPP superfamily phosphohydrolase
LRRRQWLKWAGVASAAALIGVDATLIERRRLGVNTYRIPVRHLPPAFIGFRIVQLSDLHLDPLTPLPWLCGVLDQAQRLNGQIIVCTGDYVHARGRATQVDAIWPELVRLRAPLGVFNVLGNHDHWADTGRSLEWLERSGQSVRHRARPVQIGAHRIWIAGAGDYWEDRCGIDEALAPVPTDECRIVLAHNPDTADVPWRSRVDLMLSGHTHGGQVRLPLLGAPVLPVRNKRYASGLVTTDRTRVFISRGIGWAILPVRFNCPPQIAVLELVPEAPASTGSLISGGATRTGA